MRCSKCGAENPEGKKFCGKCGAGLAGRCLKCGAENPPDNTFCGDCGASLSGLTTTPAPSARASIQAVATTGTETLEGERKTVTALFADIKGSTELEQDLDPEEARAIVDPALKLMIDAVRRYDGYIVQSTGDGIFALFGAPVAHEDHPQRALYAALRIHDENRRYADKLRADGRSPLQIRIGADTGEVVLRTIETGGKTEYSPIGHAANLASRMQSLANPGSTVISESTRKLVEGYFALKSLGATRVKGVTEPINVYEVTGLGTLRTRLQRSVGRGLTEFVGRQREMEAMKRAAELAKSGHGQIVAAVAEPGVGKSRLVFEFKAISGSGWTILEALAVSYGKGSAYLPVIDLLHAYFGIEAKDDTRQRREKVTGRVLALDRSLEDTLAYLFALLGIVEGDDTLAGMDADIRRSRTLDATKRVLLRESLNQPLMLIFEDLHWIDKETQTLLELLADSIGTAKIILLINYRPEYVHRWGGKAYYTQLSLEPLGKESANELLSTRIGDSPELASLKQLVLERTEGNPLFLEELVEAMFEDGVLVRNHVVRLGKPLDARKLPPSVQGVLVSRIDRLPKDARELLQMLAVIGREFPLALVHEVAKGAPNEIDRLMNNLQLAGFIYEQPATGGLGYIFKHALTQEVAQGSLLLERRKNLHEQVGNAIEILYRDHIDEHLSELANHYRQSRNIIKAVHFMRSAAEQAAARSAVPEAECQLHDAIDLLLSLPASSERDLLELNLQTLLGAILSLRSFGAKEKEAPLRRAADLCERITEPQEVLHALFHVDQFYIQRLRLSEAREVAERAVTLVQTLEDPAHKIGVWHNLGETHFWSGDLPAACDNFERAFALSEGISPRALIASFGLDWWLVTITFLGAAKLILGRPEVAMGLTIRMAQRAKDSSQPFSRAAGFCYGMWAAALIRADQDFVRSHLTQAKQLADEYGFPELLGWALMFDGYTCFWQGERETGLRQMIDAIKRLDAVGSLIQSSWRLAMLAEMYLELGDYPSASAMMSEAFDSIARTNERWCEPEVHRVAGELLKRRAGGDIAKAEEEFHMSIKIARLQQAKWWELRATVSLARLLRDTNRRDESRAMLSEIYNWFTEGFDTADLKDAKALLEELNE